jgi:small subunit ribosomal protein S12
MSLNYSILSKKKHSNNFGILNANPQKKGMVLKTRIVTPKKPNSARRPVAKVAVVNRRRTTSHIPGINHNLRRHSSVLIRGGGARDLPGVSYTCIRGVYDLCSVLNRKNRRSIYGVSIPENRKGKLRRKFRIVLRML